MKTNGNVAYFAWFQIVMSALSTGFTSIENRMLVRFNTIAGSIFNGIVHYLQYELVI